MGERMGRIGQIDTDFFLFFLLEFWNKSSKKEIIRINPPNPFHPFSHRITKYHNIPQSAIRNPKSN
jgi:hypothetical protein